MPRDPQHIHLAALHEDKKNIVKENPGAAMVDLGDGCLCLEVHTKMNTIDGDVVSMLSDALDEAEKNFDALVIANDGDHFGAGANLMLVVTWRRSRANGTRSIKCVGAAEEVCSEFVIRPFRW